MQILVTLPSGSVLTLEVEANDTIENVKSKVQEQAGFSPEDQTLTFEGATLEEGRTLADYNISDGSSLNLTLPSTTTTAAPTTTMAPTPTTAPTTAGPTSSSTTTVQTTTASPTTSASPTTTVPTTATTTAVLSGSATQSGSSEQLPATGGSTILLLIGMLTVILGQALVALSNRSKTRLGRT